MKSKNIKVPTLKDIEDRDGRIKIMARLLRRMAKKGSEGVISPEDLAEMEKSAEIAERLIG